MTLKELYYRVDVEARDASLAPFVCAFVDKGNPEPVDELKLDGWFNAEQIALLHEFMQGQSNAGD